MKTILPLSCAIILLCVSLTSSQENTVSLNQSGNKDPRYGIERFPQRGKGELDWGLALSGGGTRAAAFSIGAMKNLYDRGLMKEIDVISSVSGGSYASYWLFTNYYQNRNQKFGSSAFGHDLFVNKVCDLQNTDKSNVVRNVEFLGILLDGNDKGFRKYRKALENSFGNDQPAETPLNFLKDRIGKRDAPYFIINSTIDFRGTDKKKNTDLRKESSRVYEISPDFSGNPGIGFQNWPQNGAPALSESIAISGAPKFFGLIGISGIIKNQHPDSISKKTLSLTDGGFSENLGALALIRRGIRNVVIVDAEADPAYKFDAYLQLQRLLKEQNIDFRVKDIENFRKGKGELKGVSIGKAVSKNEGSLDTTVYYIKMADPERVLSSIFPIKSDDEDERENKMDFIDEGRKIAIERQCDRCPAAPRKGELLSKKVLQSCEKNTGCNCDKIDLDMGPKGERYASFYANRVWEYNNTIDKVKIKRFGLWTKVKSFNAAGKVCYFTSAPFGSRTFDGFCSMLSYDFPHMTTLDQSYFSDQLEAVVGLGYLQARELDIPSFN